MKQLKWFGALCLLVTSAALAHATCLTPLSNASVEGPPYQVVYATGPNQSCLDYYLDTSGNQAVWGTAFVQGRSTLTGSVIYPSVNVTAISSMTTISPTQGFLLLLSTGGLVTIGGTVASVSTATATNGQYLILGSTVPTDSQGTVAVSSGTASGMHLGAATRTIGAGAMLTLMYNSVKAMWMETAYTVQ